MLVLDEGGQGGAGTMIVFVAAILVSSIAAGTYISYGSDLFGKGEGAAKDTIGTTSSRLSVTSVIISDQDLDQDIDDLYITIGLFPGSDPIDLSTVTLTVTAKDHRAMLGYSPLVDGEGSAHYCCEMPSPDEGGSGTLGILSDPRGLFRSDVPILSEGTEVQVHVDIVAAFGSGILAGETMDVLLEPKNGLSEYDRFTVPHVILRNLTVLE